MMEINLFFVLESSEKSNIVVDWRLRVDVNESDKCADGEVKLEV